MDVVLAVVRSVADHEGDSPTELPPLADVVDPDSLRTFVNSRTNTGATVRFVYCGYDVVVRDDGHVEVTPRRSRYRVR